MFLSCSSSTKDNVNLTKQLNDGFKRSVYQSNYPAIAAKVTDNETNIYESLSVSLQGLFVLAYDAADNDNAGIKKQLKEFSSKSNN